MHVFITSDANQESGVGEFVDKVSGRTDAHFHEKDYGVGLHGLVVVLMCRNPDLKFKQRIRLSKKEKKLYMDIMLNLDEMKDATHETRKCIITERLANEVPAILRKYSIRDFDEERFVADLRSWLQEIR